ncbi:MAG: helix-turn-helix transcriptional regulator [Lachnospiraceae bacterium]|jgi:AraC-like DNA-binding protein|nr:helix-turn-helix transcriptional regulator [Lachnospiraceae bacterium]
MNYIHFTGYDAQHPDDFIFEVTEGYNCYLLLLTHTPARFCIDGMTEEYPAHCAMLYPPHTPIWYSASTDCYSDDWVRFSSDETFVQNFPQTNRPFLISDPDYCHNLIQLLTWETSLWTGTSRSFHHAKADDCANQSNESNSPVISQLLRILFLKLRDDVLHHAVFPHDHALLMLRRQISNNPQLPWTIQNMAELLHISSGHLQLLYKQQFGVSCMNDVIDFRLRKAKDLLVYTEQSITQIAEQCGYKSAEHFCRQFHKNIGSTPGKFRKSIASRQNFERFPFS